MTAEIAISLSSPSLSHDSIIKAFGLDVSNFIAVRMGFPNEKQYSNIV